ncbi:di-/tricarboxylate transporter [Halogeometricum borinquense DSM 11551]|uniref:Di-/tricarboxylate transporter n=1 Tax=Halogeometricum borinquense (strain ATCC 700274 / DSM 11551 / JCM 10706 / KCTC 4070 / PR3) TaxID=469382 RepID=E4NL75_HALBP|nr:SLC13 family permease [Halogeometricum borinquense]ADQ68324.1 di-/tricarboxylate transporter [Halogeometricum borinquense DSM 11551]ELY24635.1 di-/tricarboxylate transporter [Halogeometricum borinquense DSM 11551]
MLQTVPAAAVQLAGVSLPVSVLVVFAVVLGAVVLFVTEAVSPDVTAIAVIVALVALEPFTKVSAAEGLSGFSNPATVTILAMYILSRGIQRTGVVRRLGVEVAHLTRGSENRLLVAIIALTGPIAGIVNNTPVVAVFIPMVTDLANESGVSPSKLLIPLSYASMLAGTLTLFGTATNLVASELSADLLGRPFGVFLLTPVGIVAFLVGAAYLLTVGRWLLPARVPPGSRTERYEMQPYLARVLVTARSPFVGNSAQTVAADAHRDLGLDVLDVVRGADHFVATDSDRELASRDILTVRGNPPTIQQFVEYGSLRLLPRATVTDAELDNPERSTLVELIVPADSSLVGETVTGARLRERYDATVLAIRRAGGELVRDDIGETQLHGGDALLLQTTEVSAEFLAENDDVVVTGEVFDEVMARVREGGVSSTALIAFGILFGVVAVAALGLLPISVAALTGVLAMFVTGVLSPNEAYDAVNWSVIFLLAGIIPLGIALRETGAAALVADAVSGVAVGLPPLVVLVLFYLLTGAFANVITPVASVVLFLPIAASTASSIGADPFSFVLGVTFAATTAFMTPVGYQTNLMVYGPGGYTFSDYVRVGAPLQLLLAVVTSVAIALYWGL